MVNRGCLDAIMAGHVNSGQVRSGKVKSGQVMLGQVKSGQFKSGQVKSRLGISRNFKSGPVFRTGQIRTEQVGTV